MARIPERPIPQPEAPALQSPCDSIPYRRLNGPETTDSPSPVHWLRCVVGSGMFDNRETIQNAQCELRSSSGHVARSRILQSAKMLDSFRPPTHESRSPLCSSK